MHRDPDTANASTSARETKSANEASIMSSSSLAGGGAGKEPAALNAGPGQTPGAETSATAQPPDSPAEARGRRILSRAFVMMGPDGRLSLELHGGRSLVLRNVVMRRRKFCGEQVFGSQTGVQYCGGYAEVAAARPGPVPAHDEPDLAIPNPLKANPPDKD